MPNSFKLSPKQFSNEERKIFLRPLFMDILLWGPIVPQSLDLHARQSHFSHLSQTSFARRKEMTFDCRLKTLEILLFSFYIALPLTI